MLLRRELTVGKSYVNEKLRIAREVIDVDHNIVKYKTYNLKTGQLLGDTRECEKRDLIRWADREATHKEMANLQHQEAEALYVVPPPAREPEQNLSIEQVRLMARNSMVNR